MSPPQRGTIVKQETQTHPQQNTVSPRNQLDLDLIAELTVQIAQLVCDEALTKRTQRLVHQRHGQWTPFATQSLALRQHVAALGQLVTVTPKVGRDIARRLWDTDNDWRMSRRRMRSWWTSIDDDCRRRLRDDGERGSRLSRWRPARNRGNWTILLLLLR